MNTYSMEKPQIKKKEEEEEEEKAISTLFSIWQLPMNFE